MSVMSYTANPSVLSQKVLSNWDRIEVAEMGCKMRILDKIKELEVLR